MVREIKDISPKEQDVLYRWGHKFLRFNMLEGHVAGVYLGNFNPYEVKEIKRQLYFLNQQPYKPRASQILDIVNRIA